MSWSRSEIDSDAVGFEAHLNGVANNATMLSSLDIVGGLAQDLALRQQFEKEVVALAKEWQKVEEDSREFLDKQYTPCLRERQELQQAKAEGVRDAAPYGAAEAAPSRRAKGQDLTSALIQLKNPDYILQALLHDITMAKTITSLVAMASQQKISADMPQFEQY
ncbi:hypothetical protein AK812_SmicGene23713 [Symbiodinium microadriaticum]|uniref:Uncharacterized protein n=1 Tax=Symbiodinium microadriaticum TaxID=2951 RepID=A0A1Q9DGF5_SYMMI|nr:hypothetical protein AK812_SmicGene23713 [Symbiodinium microadriaticum]